jgi:hypothetical protein
LSENKLTFHPPMICAQACTRFGTQAARKDNA